ncbi:MAG: hypothetical protein FGM41_05090 [Bacteroidetes bacterium]|nr:hypothetical protein [Bacteroidota bacterium]
MKTGLGDRYSDYVKLINKSASGDGEALVLFLQYQNIDDGAGYDHGWVLIELMKKVGDEQFSDALLNLSPTQVDHVKNYFNAGFDVHTKTDKLFNEYPKTFKVLGYSDIGGVPFK